MRKILHVDLDAFFCSVEEILDPALKEKVFVTGGSPDGRGVVSSCSYPARQFGIHSAMPMKQALKKFPRLIIISGHYEKYGKFSKEVMKIIREFSPLVEQISIDEAFLDVSDLPENPRQIAIDLQMLIYSKLSLPCSIGAATNKLVAKIATNIGKSHSKSGKPPMAINVIEPGNEQKFLDPLPVAEMWGIGPKTSAIMNQMGIKTIGNIVSFPRDLLQKRFGNFAYDLIQRAKGIDDHPVSDGEGIKSISNEITFPKDVTEKAELISVLIRLCEKTALRLRRKRLAGKTIKIKIRWPNFETLTRQMTLPQPTNQDSVIFQSASFLFDSVWRTGNPVRLLGIGVAGLASEFQQLSLYDDSYVKEKKLLSAIDELQERFGDGTIQKGFHSRGGKYI